MSSSNHNTVSSQAASESTPAIPLMMPGMRTTFAPITTVGSIGMIPIMSTPTPAPTTTIFPGSITTPGGAFAPYPSAWAQFAADPANAQALQGYQQVMAMMQQTGGFMPFAYPGMTPPIMPPPVSTPSTVVPRMVPVRSVNLTGIMNEAAPSNVHEVDEAEQEVARRRKGKAIVKPSKTRDSAFKRLGDKEDGPRKSAKLRLGPEMGRTSAIERLAQMAGCIDAEECLLFFSSLRGRPVEWFNGLPHGRIGSFEKFANVFRKKYQDNCIKRKKFTYLNTTAMSLLMNAFRSGDLYTEFCRRPPSSYQEAYNTAWEYAEAEVLNKSKRELEEGHTKVKSDKPKKDDQMGGSKPKATYDGSIHQIRDEKKGEQHKRPWTEKWCTYHQSDSHNTTDCRNVRVVLREMTLKGELGEILYSLRGLRKTHRRVLESTQMNMIRERREGGANGGYTTDIVVRGPDLDNDDISAVELSANDICTNLDFQVVTRFDPTKIELDAIYENKGYLIYHLKMLAISNLFQFHTKRSTKKLLHVVCVENRYDHEHQCPIDARQGRTRQATYDIIADLVKYKYSDATNKPYPPKAIMTDMCRDHGISMSYKKAWSAKKRAMQLAFGSDAESYAMLPAMCYMLDRANPVQYILSDRHGGIIKAAKAHFPRDYHQPVFAIKK
ncbi:unnamed protein product [Cuscuta campestris]|uniref:Retrotransposon gag domain-containing protein n=1 Tax=Cuscuta campestris TaxID=132261 RepID=A0A484LSL6_9ASTE|nr:unnamed protein product [Cuscuta campestris]